MAKTDILVIAAHPDDAELTCGGSIIKAVKEGKTVAVADCTRGELGTRGTPALRQQEAADAAAILGISERVNVGIEDGNIAVTTDNVKKIVQVIRHFQPSMILFPGERDRHIDHEDVHALVRKAIFQSGLPKVETHGGDGVQEVWRPQKTLCYMQTYEFPVDVYLDISDEFEQKIAAMRAYSSQFYVPGMESDEPTTFISGANFMEFIEARARYFGGKIGVRYAEAFASVEPIGLPSLSALLPI